MILFHAFKENIGDDVFHKFISYFALYHVFFFLKISTCTIKKLGWSMPGNSVLVFS